MSKSLTELQGPVHALFTDLDGTMATGGRLSAQAFASLHELFAAGLPVVLVTGRPAGWGHALANLLPFTAVITENGGVSFVPDGTGFRKEIGMPDAELRRWQAIMREALADATEKFPGAQLSADSAYREVDLAIDWNEDAKLEAAQADRIMGMMHERGLAATRSSVHVNYGPPGIDKWVACERILSSCFAHLAGNYEGIVYVGDSLNDAPVFAALEKSVGVANVRQRWAQLSNKPKYTTEGEEGAGFSELVERLLALI